MSSKSLDGTACDESADQCYNPTSGAVIWKQPAETLAV